MDIIKDVEGVAGVAVSAANPLALYAKLGGIVILGAALAYLTFRVVSFVETAAADHAARELLTGQLDTAKKTNADNLMTFRLAEEQHRANADTLNALAADATKRSNALNIKLEAARHAPPSPACKTSAATSDLLSSLRHQPASNAAH